MVGLARYPLATDFFLISAFITDFQLNLFQVWHEIKKIKQTSVPRVVGMGKEMMPTAAWPSVLFGPEGFRPMNRLQRPSAVHLKSSKCEGKEVRPCPWKTQSQTSAEIALCNHLLFRDSAPVQQSWNSESLLSLDFCKPSNVMGRAAPLEVCLPPPPPSCVGILHLPCACFFVLEKTPRESAMVACASNPSTQEVEAGRSGVQSEPEI